MIHKVPHLKPLVHFHADGPVSEHFGQADTEVGLGSDGESPLVAHLHGGRAHFLKLEGVGLLLVRVVVELSFQTDGPRTRSVAVGQSLAR